MIHFLYHPDHVRRVLFDNPKNYLRGWQYRLLGNLFGDNLVASEGSSWLLQRRLAQPAFHRQRLAGYANVMSCRVTPPEAVAYLMELGCASDLDGTSQDLLGVHGGVTGRVKTCPTTRTPKL